MTIKNKIAALIIAVIASTVFPLSTSAQEDDGGFRDIVIYTAVKRFDRHNVPENGPGRPKEVQYCLMKLRQAQDAVIALNKAIDKDNEDPLGNWIPKTIKELKIDFDNSENNGKISINAKDGMAVLIMDVNGSYPKCIEIVRGKSEYRDIALKEVGITIPDVIVTSKGGEKPEIAQINIDDGINIHCKLSINYPKGFLTQNDRMILQPVAIDCQTEDTVALFPPRVFEGARYHSLQNKRKGFDFFANDPMANYYVSSNTYDQAKYHDENASLSEDKDFFFSYQEMVKKPDPQKKYRTAYTIAVEDFTHERMPREITESGSCLLFSPFKLLNYNIAAAELDIRNFKVEAKEKFSKHNQDLALVFETGTDVLVKDSANIALLNELTSELRSYGERLWEVKVGGAASPEGNPDRNLKLAALRQDYAMSVLRSNLRGADVSITKLPVKVYTWYDVAEELYKRNLRAESARVKEIADQVGSGNPTEQMKALDFYDSAIEPVLAKQRNMKFSYLVQKAKQMTPEEVVEFYYVNKDKLRSGKETLSSGDFYNLYQYINNEEEADTITEIAYTQMVKEPNYEYIKFNSYIANRMAMLCIKRNIADSTILAPFIDLTVKRIDFEHRGQNRWINLKEHLTNQAIMLFQGGDLGTAMYLLNLLPKTGLHAKLQHYANLRVYYLMPVKTPEQEQMVNNSLNYIMETSEENKAVLCTELRKMLPKDLAEQAPMCVENMDNDNPKKWYLKGLLAAERALNTPAGQTPDFLAYFQHSFDLEKSYRRHYNTEGGFDDKIRKKYPYKYEDRKKYRERFKEIIMQQYDLRANSEVNTNNNTEASIDNNEANNATTVEQ